MILQDRIECLQELYDHPNEYHLSPRTIVALQWVIEDLKKEKERIYMTTPEEQKYDEVWNSLDLKTKKLLIDTLAYSLADAQFTGQRRFLQSDEQPAVDEERDPMAGGLIFRS